MPDAAAPVVHQYVMRTLQAGRKDRALAVALENRRLHPADRFVTYVGLARAYTATGDKKKAIENWELALRNLPAQQETRRPEFERALKALREG
jgi:tetratricopeptide (TPR) repeat protein